MTALRPHRASRGRLVALEGIDGAGKSTLLRALGRALRRRGFSVRLRHEPVDPTIGRVAQEAGARDAWTGAVYFTVDRHLAAPGLRRDLRRFDVVLSDRSFYSTLAYQGSTLTPRERRRLAELQRRATVEPDQVLLLDLPASWLERRLRRRAGTRGPLERSRALARVAASYRAIARQRRWRTLDARRSSTQLVGDALEALRLADRRSRAGRRRKPLKTRAGPGRSG